jgi:hypothetical protein
MGASSGRIVDHWQCSKRGVRGRRRSVLRSCTVLAALGLASLATSGPASAGQAGDRKTFCRATTDLIEHVLSEDRIPGDDASSAKVEKFRKKLTAVLNRAERAAPPEISNDVSYASELMQVDPRTADTNFFLEILAPLQAVKRFVADNCEFKTVAVTARENEFEGIPNTLTRGTVVFELRNEGAEVHEMAFGRIRGDASLEAVLALPAEERRRQNRIEEIGAGAIAAPGGMDIAIVTFTKSSRHSVACFTPSGTTSIDAPSDGPPHTDLGMFQEFQVKER